MPKTTGKLTKDFTIMDYRKLAQDALDKRARLVTELRAVNDDATLTDAAKQERSEKINGDIVSLTDEARGHIEDGEREALVAGLGTRAAALTGAAPETRSDEPTAMEKFRDELRSVVGRGGSSMEVQADSYDTRAAAGANTAVLTDSAWAGTTVQNTFVAQILESLREYSPILSAGVRTIVTSGGEKMQWPVKNSGLIASRVNEGAVYPRSKGGFSRWELDAFKYGVIAEATQEMLTDSALPLESIIAQDLGEAIADRTALDFTKGSGTGEPHGLVTSTTLNSALANRAAITSDALVTHTHSIKPVYRRNAKWYVSDDFVLAARLLKDGQGRYIWQDGLQAGVPDTLLGKPVIVDVNMDVATGAGKIPALFGDFSKFIVRFVGGVNLSRSDEYGWDADVVAWKVNVRADSGQSDAASVSKITLTA